MCCKIWKCGASLQIEGVDPAIDILRMFSSMSSSCLAGRHECIHKRPGEGRISCRRSASSYTKSIWASAPTILWDLCLLSLPSEALPSLHKTYSQRPEPRLVLVHFSCTANSQRDMFMYVYISMADASPFERALGLANVLVVKQKRKK